MLPLFEKCCFSGQEYEAFKYNMFFLHLKNKYILQDFLRL